MGRTFLPGIILAVFLVLGCSSADPEIMQLDLRVVAELSSTDGTIEERLQVRVDVHDPDGDEELSRIRVIHEGRGLQWDVGVSEVRHLPEDGQEWYGLEVHPVPGEPGVPRGTYRVEVEDLGGRIATREASLPLNLPTSKEDDFLRYGSGELLFPSDSYRAQVVVPGEEADGSFLVHELVRSEDAPEIIPIESISPETARIIATHGDTGELWFLLEVNRYLWRRSGPW